MRSRWALAAVLMLLLAGCDDKRANTNRDEATAERNAALQAEQRLMSDMAVASTELQKRVSEGFSSDNGILFVVDAPVRPRSTCTVINCHLDLFHAGAAERKEWVKYP